MASLTGIRAVAAILVMATHAAYATGKYTHGYVGLVYARMEIGVPIFFVLSGFLLFRPWVKPPAEGADAVGPPLCLAPGAADHAGIRGHRGRWRIVYHFRNAGPNPGHTWIGFLRNLSLTQIYTDQYMYSYLHQGLTQMWSLAVEAAFYVVLPLLAWLLLVVVCRRQWRPMLLLGGLLLLAAVTPAWLIFVHTVDGLPDGARLWLPTYLLWFVGGMLLAVLAVMGVRCYAFAVLPVAVVSYFIASTPIAGNRRRPLALAPAIWKAVFYAVIATLAVAPLALGDRGWYTRLLASRPMVFLGEISYEIFLIHLLTMELVMMEILHYPICTGSMPLTWPFIGDGSAGLAVAPFTMCAPIAPAAATRQSGKLACPQ